MSRVYVPHLEKVYSNLRQKFDREPGDTIEDFDASSLIWRMFVSVTLNAAVHLGNDYLENSHSTKNQLQVKQLFDVTKLTMDQKGVQGKSVIDWQQRSWQRTIL